MKLAWCFAHSLQLVVHDVVLTQHYIDLLAVCRSVVGHFKHSSVASHKLTTIQDNLGLPQHTLKQDVATRRNSTLYMFHSVLKQKMALAAYTAENDIPQLTANQLEIARKMVLIIALHKPADNNGRGFLHTYRLINGCGYHMPTESNIHKWA